MAEGQTEGQGQNAPTLSAEEQAAVEVGQRGFSEPTNVNTPAPAGDQRPEYIPEKFWKDGKPDLEGLAKSYSELEKKFSTPKDQAEQQQQAPTGDQTRADGKIEAKADEGDGKAADEQQPPAVTSAMEAARDEWAEKRELSDDTFAALEAAGIPRPIVDLYLEGIKANEEKLMGQIHGFVGGEQAYNQMVQWAASNMTADEIAAYNDALDNPALRETAVVGLQAKFARSNPSEGKLVTPSDSGAAASDVFRSRDEMTAAQRDPRYGTDPAYRQSVMDKLMRSQKAGFTAFDRPKFERQVFST